MALSGIFRHYKGRYYQIVCLARHTETGEDLVNYKAYQPPGWQGPTYSMIWCRPKKMFEGYVEDINNKGRKVPRFTKVSVCEADRHGCTIADTLKPVVD